MSLVLITTLILLPLILIRLLRWVAIVQQKNYRPDRIITFLKTSEGIQELSRIAPRLKDFTRKGIKRPVRTARGLVLLLLGLLVIASLLYLSYATSEGAFLTSAVLIYLLMPLVVFISNLPTRIISSTILFIMFNKVRALIKKKQPKIIALTGSYGKTSTKLMLAHVLGQQRRVFTTPKSFNQSYSILNSILTDYDDEEYMILEFAAYKKGEVGQLAKYMKPEVGIITGLTNQHLNTFKSIEGIIKAKGELVAALDDKSKAFYNGNDGGALKICKSGGANNPKDYTKVSGLKARLNSQGRVELDWGGEKVKTNIVGLHYLSAIQASINISLEEGVSRQAIIKGLKSFDPGDNFVGISKTKKGAIVINDGQTANKVGFKSALDVLEHIKKENPKRKTYLIFWGIIDLVDQSEETHAELAKLSKKLVDEVWYVGLDGIEQFREVFGDKLIDQERSIKSRLKNLGKEDILLVEGHIPQQYESYIQ